MQMVKIRATWFEAAVPKWEAGSLYPLDAESQRQVDIGNGDVIDVAETANDADDAADEAAAGDAAARPSKKKAKG